MGGLWQGRHRAGGRQPAGKVVLTPVPSPLVVPLLQVDLVLLDQPNCLYTIRYAPLWVGWLGQGGMLASSCLGLVIACLPTHHRTPSQPNPDPNLTASPHPPPAQHQA